MVSKTLPLGRYPKNTHFSTQHTACSNGAVRVMFANGNAHDSRGAENPLHCHSAA